MSTIPRQVIASICVTEIPFTKLEETIITEVAVCVINDPPGEYLDIWRRCVVLSLSKLFERTPYL